MNKFRMRMAEFMRGRYGFDELGRSVFAVVIVLMIASIIFNLAGHLINGPLYIASGVANWAGFALLIYASFRIMSRNYEARRAENEKFLKRRKKLSLRKSTSI